MPFCPECQAEYREGFTRCSACDLDLVEQLPEAFDLSEENIHQALEGQDLVPVVRGDFEVLKEIRAFLSSQRVASLLLDDKEFQAPPGAPKRVMLAVGSADEEHARLILGEKFQDMVANEGLDADAELSYGACPACGHGVEEDQEECPECGLFIGKA